MSDSQPTQPQPTDAQPSDPPVEVTSDPAALDPALAPQPVAEEPLPSSRRKVVITVVVIAVVAVLAVVGIVLALNLAPKSEPVPQGSDEPVAEEPSGGIEGVSYESSEFGYSVVFPAEPEESSQTFPVGDVELTLNSVVWQEGQQTLIANATRYPAEMLTDTDTMLEGSVDGAIANVPGAELVSDEQIDLAGMPARKIVATAPAGEVRLIIAIETDVQYQLLAANTDEATAEAFFASFQKR